MDATFPLAGHITDGLDEILVRVSTSPNWTPAIAGSAGCVRDTGDALSHTAIASRGSRERD